MRHGRFLTINMFRVQSRACTDTVLRAVKAGRRFLLGLFFFAIAGLGFTQATWAASAGCTAFNNHYATGTIIWLHGGTEYVEFPGFDPGDTVSWRISMPVDGYFGIGDLEGYYGPVSNSSGSHTFSASDAAAGLTLELQGVGTGGQSVFIHNFSCSPVGGWPLLTLAPAPGTALTAGTVNLAYSDNAISATGGSSAITYSASGLPTGLSINATTGVISGTPTLAGDYTVTVMATAGADSVSQTYPLHIGAQPVLSVVSVSVMEGDSGRTSAVLGITLTEPAPAGGVSFHIATADDTAIAGEDYEATSRTGAIGPGSRGVWFSVDIFGDTVVEPDERFFVNVTNITGAIPGDTVGIVTILNDDVAPMPRMGSVTPYRGHTAGGTTVTITGTDLTDATSVTFGGVAAISYTVDSSTRITAIAPAHVAGFVDVSVITPGGSATLGSGFEYIGPPAITSFSPNTGPTTGGTRVIVEGTNLVYPSVTVGGVSTPPLAWTSNSIQFETPPHSAGTFDIVITTEGGSVTAGGGFTYTDPVPITHPVSASMAYGSVENPIMLHITGGTPDSVSIATAASHGAAVVSGTNIIRYTPGPGYAGPDSFTYTATNGAGTSAPAMVTIRVNPPRLSMTPPTGTLTLDYGQEYSETFSASGGAEPYSYALTGTLPAGLGFDTGTGTLSGTPTQIGTFPSVTVTATDSSTGSGAPFSVATSYTVHVNPPTITLTPASLPSGTAGTVYSANLTASGGIGPYTYSVDTGDLPPGLNLADDGTLSGTPTAAGTFVFRLQARDAHGRVGSRAYTIGIAPVPPLPVFVAHPTNSTILVEGSTMFSATAVNATGYRWQVMTGGAFTDISDGGVYSGTTLGTLSITGADASMSGYIYRVVATGPGGSTASNSATLTVAPPLALEPPVGTILDAGQVGTAYSETAISASGGLGAITYDAFGLPDGLSIDSSTGAITGTPTSAGTRTITVTATATTLGGRVGAIYIITIAPAPPVVLTPPAGTTLAPGAVNSPYSNTSISASGGDGSITYVAFGFPDGLDIDAASGVISGIPTEHGTFPITVTAIAAVRGSASAGYTLTIIDMPVTTNPVSATVAYGSTANPISLDIAGGTPTSVAIADEPSHGTATAVGTSITYMPEPGYAGTDSFTYTAANDAGASAPATVTITVSPPALTISPAAGTLVLDYGVAYGETFSAEGGAAPYGYALTGALPAGLSLNTTTGVLSGTPTQVGDFPVTVTATDSSTGSGAPFSVAISYTVHVNPPTITLTPASLPAGTAGTAYNETLSADGGIGPYTFSVESGDPPPGLDLDDNGTLSGTPTANGAFVFRLQAQDAHGRSGSRAYTLIVSGGTLTLAPSTVPDGTVGSTYQESFSTTGGVSPYSYAITAGALPPGLDLDDDGTLSGTPTAPGTFNFDVTASDDNGGTPSITTVRYALFIVSIDATLSALVLSEGALDPAFAPGNPTYTATVPNATGSITVTPTAADANATIIVDGSPVASGGQSGAISLNVGANTITTIVTAQDGTTTRTYTVTVTRAASADATLAGLAPSVGTFDPAFDPATTSYVVAVNNATKEIALTPTAAEPNATITVAGQAVASGSASQAIAFAVGATAIPVVVTAQDGTTIRTYTVTVVRAASADATLAGLAPSVGILDPTFNAATTSYAVAVDNATKEIALTPTAAEPNATITVAGQAVTSGSAGQAIALTVGATTIPIVVTAEDATTSQTYLVTVTRTASANATLASLLPSVGALDPAFDPAGTDYAVEIDNAIESVALTPTAAEPNATITVAGQAVASGSASQAVTLAIGETAIPIVVTAEDGKTMRTYTVTVMRAALVRPDPSLDPEVIGLINAQTNTATRFAQNQIRNFHSRLEQLHDEGARRASSMNIRIGITQHDPGSAEQAIDQLVADSHSAVAAPHGAATPGMLAYGPEAGRMPDGVGETGRTSSFVGPDLGPFAVWSGGFVNFGERDTGGLDLDHTMVGVSGGVDYRFSEQFVGGVGIGYGRDRTDIGENGTESRANAFSAALYGSYKPIDNLFIDGLLGGSWLDFDSTRYVTSNGAFATGNRSGRQIFGSLTAAYEFRDETWLISPYGTVAFSRSWLDGFTETGGNIYGLTYGGQTVDTLSGVLGIRANYAFRMDWGLLTPGVRAEYTRDFAGSSRASLGYTDLGGLPHAIDVDPQMRDFVTLGLSLDMQIENDWSLGFDYRTSFGGSGNQDHTLGARLGARF